VACQHLGSPLYAGLLGHAAADLLAGGPVAAVLDGYLTAPSRSALGLRMLGGVHALVLAGQAPELAAFYPSAGGTAGPGPDGARAWAAARRVLAGQRDAIRAWLDRPPQTNEVGRAAALLGGPSARFAWLALEPHRHTPNGECLVTLTTWPGGTGRVLATAPSHGLPVLWGRS
jgi:hypothetical protein